VGDRGGRRGERMAEKWGGDRMGGIETHTQKQKVLKWERGEKKEYRKEKA